MSHHVHQKLENPDWPLAVCHSCTVVQTAPLCRPGSWINILTRCCRGSVPPPSWRGRAAGLCPAAYPLHLPPLCFSVHSPQNNRAAPSGRLDGTVTTYNRWRRQSPRDGAACACVRVTSIKNAGAAPPSPHSTEYIAASSRPMLVAKFYTYYTKKRHIFSRSDSHRHSWRISNSFKKKKKKQIKKKKN